MTTKHSFTKVFGTILMVAMLLLTAGNFSLAGASPGQIVPKQALSQDESDSVFDEGLESSDSTDQADQTVPGDSDNASDASDTSSDSGHMEVNDNDVDTSSEEANPGDNGDDKSQVSTVNNVVENPDAEDLPLVDSPEIDSPAAPDYDDSAFTFPLCIMIPGQPESTQRAESVEDALNKNMLYDIGGGELRLSRGVWVIDCVNDEVPDPDPVYVQFCHSSDGVFFEYVGAVEEGSDEYKTYVADSTYFQVINEEDCISPNPLPAPSVKIATVTCAGVVSGTYQNIRFGLDIRILNGADHSQEIGSKQFNQSALDPSGSGNFSFDFGIVPGSNSSIHAMVGQNRPGTDWLATGDSDECEDSQQESGEVVITITSLVCADGQATVTYSVDNSYTGAINHGDVAWFVSQEEWKSDPESANKALLWKTVPIVMGANGENQTASSDVPISYDTVHVSISFNMTGGEYGKTFSATESASCQSDPGTGDPDPSDPGTGNPDDDGTTTLQKLINELVKILLRILNEILAGLAAA